MKVIYKCSCMPEEVEILVTDRHPDGDILPWMHLVQVAIGTDHEARSPKCKAATMEYAKIPVEDKDLPIGVAKPRN